MRAAAAAAAPPAAPAAPMAPSLPRAGRAAAGRAAAGRAAAAAAAGPAPRAAATAGRRRAVAARSSGGNNKPSLGDDLLDFVTAGPKLRKWYGAGERMPRDGDGGEGEEEPGPPEPEAAGGGDGVLVTDADSATGELVLLQLILARVPDVRALFRDITARLPAGLRAARICLAAPPAAGFGRARRARLF